MIQKKKTRRLKANVQSNQALCKMARKRGRIQVEESMAMSQRKGIRTKERTQGMGRCPGPLHLAVPGAACSATRLNTAPKGAQ